MCMLVRVVCERLASYVCLMTELPYSPEINTLSKAVHASGIDVTAHKTDALLDTFYPQSNNPSNL